MEKKIEQIGLEINHINYKLLRLLNNLALLTKEMSDLKGGNNIEFFDPSSQAEIFASLFEHNQGPLSNELIKDIFTSIFSASLWHVGKKTDRDLLISTSYNNEFLNINEIFETKFERPITIAGPCSIEKTDYLDDVGKLLSNNQIKFIRGGAFKPRTSPYDFQGLGETGLIILNEIGKKYNLFTVTEVVDTRDVEITAKYVDIIQIGARNMYNYELLKEVGQTKYPVLLKRGLSATINEWMLAAEYIALQGNRKIILCERGIRTYETKTRNTLDISSIPIIKMETSLPIIVDLSHSLGRKDIIKPLAKAALAAGADGLMIEVHPYPELALSDGKQQLDFDEFLSLMKFIEW